MISGFTFYENFTEINPYFNITLPSKPNEILDAYYKRIIFISTLLAKSFLKIVDLSFFDQIFRELAAKYKENSSSLLILLSICSEIVKNDQKYLGQLKTCSLEFLENILNLEYYEVCRNDIKDLEIQIVNNLQTLKILLNSQKNNPLYLILNEFLKRPNLEKRKKLEEIYNKVTSYKNFLI